MRALVASLLVGALVVVGAVRAHAEPDHAAALSSLKRGVDAFRAGRYRDAVPHFEAAQKLAPDKPNPYRWLALAYMQLGNCPRVLVNASSFLARAAAGDTRRAELVRLQTLCRSTGVLRVYAEPKPAHVSIDGQRAGTTPYTSLSMRAGDHTVAAQRSGYARESRVVAIAPGGQHDVTFRLSRSR